MLLYKYVAHFVEVLMLLDFIPIGNQKELLGNAIHANEIGLIEMVITYITKSK